jgi:hypothetical protein
MEIDKDFPLYSNMDFFLIQVLSGSLKFEVRIDPTREKKLLDPLKNVVEITVREIMTQQGTY